jgi:hypothetical protein
MDVIYQISRAQKYHRRSKSTAKSGISPGRFIHRAKALVDLGVNYFGRALISYVFVERNQRLQELR